jgi:RimJ/RimL family protein N-acetyltransferase
MKQQATLQTERLILRPFAMADARDVHRLAGDRAIADTTLNVPHPYQDGMAEQWIATHQPEFEAGELANFAVVLRGTGELVGAIGLMIHRRFDRAELGYWIGRPYWKQGYCTEAGRAVLAYGFTELNLNRIHASYLSRNPASGRVMEKLGMTREGVLRQHVKKWDRFEDLELFAILKQEWERMVNHTQPDLQNRDPSKKENGMAANTPAVSKYAVVSLREVTKDNLAAILALEVADHQKQFVATNAKSIAQAHFAGDKAWFRAIYADETPVGFLMLEDDRENQAYFLWRFMIDQRFQRNGFGWRALALLVDHVKTLPGARELLTSYVPGEGSPGTFYHAHGFVDDGRVEDGENVSVLKL